MMNEEDARTNTHTNTHDPPSGTETKSSRQRSSRSQRELSPEDYANLIYAHASRSINSSIFPGHNYTDLVTWLQAPPRRYAKAHASAAPDGHCLAVLYNLGATETSERRQYFKADDLDDFRKAPKPGKDCGQVLMLRGCPSSDWIKAIGGKYRLDPEFIRRHLDFFATMTSRNAFSLPSVQSSYSNIVQLTGSTIISQDPSRARIRKPDIQAWRRAQADKMATYFRKYQNISRCGDSIVRDHCILDADHSILDQSISICVQRCEEGGWTGMGSPSRDSSLIADTHLAVVWLDGGKRLSNSYDLWLGSAYFNPLPVIHHHSKMSSIQGTLENIDASCTEPQSADLIIGRASMNQSMQVLPFELDMLLDAKTAKADAFYALHNVFQHAAYSEAQALNVLDSQIKQEIGVLTHESERSSSLDSLQYFILLLDRHVEQINQTLRAVRVRGGQDWPKTKGKSKRAKRAAEKLRDNFDGLLARGLDLRRQCINGMSVMMNRAVVAESRKGIEQAERVKRLTVLATIFIPISFVTSLFGMNFREFGTGKLSIWLFVAVAIPVLICAYIAFIWNYAYVRRLGPALRAAFAVFKDIEFSLLLRRRSNKSEE